MQWPVAWVLGARLTVMDSWQVLGQPIYLSLLYFNSYFYLGNDMKKTL